ncbi:MAG: amino acid adenylation domain-containing protein, partial [Chloroflexi bacterium]|nr:amino acid adenylation domain-containing protein [Chloroflexota bacterium]
RTDLSGNPTFRELLGRVREAALGAYAHQDLPFEYLVEQLHPQRDLSRQPIFQVAFVLQNAPLPPLRLEDLTLSVLDVDSGTAKFDLTLYMWERVDGLGGALEYATDLFDAPTISRMIDHLQMLLDQILADPARSIGQVPLLAATEHEQLRTLWSTTQIELPPTTIQALIEEQVARTPAAVAVVFGEQTLSYADLNQRANHLAHYLQALGVGPDVRVGVCMERAPEMIVGIIGILKAGGAYVPIDPTYPRERIQLMLADAQAPLLLTHERLRQQLPQTEARIVALDAEWPEIARQPPTNPASRATADHLAYVIYTSGSTGRPKGTLITQRGLCNLVAAQIAAFEITPTSRVLQFASLSFDASASEIFTALVAGASLHLVSRDVMLSPPDLARLMRDQQITTVTLPPALLALLPPENLPDLVVVVSAGEACSTSLAMRWLDQTDTHTRRLINAYGPTEATIGPTYYVVAQPLEEGADVPIGRPIANIQTYVLDAYGQPMPLGVPGELYIGGVGVARGYLNQPALTAEKFVPDPFSQPGARMYRTGDRARFRADGNLEFLGRIDEQVKVRGFRIELNEIEAVLSQHPAVREAVVTAHDQRLVAYVVTEQGNKETKEQRTSDQNLERRTQNLNDEDLGSRFLVLGSHDSVEQIDQWQQLFDETYREVAPDYDPTFNVSGWNSSYTGQPIPEQQMRVWVEQTVARIKALRPRRVLEIGCGTGLLLFRIAPECEHYVGTDFSRAALHSVEQLLGPRNLSQVALLHQPAHDFSAMKPGSFDTVVLNSVAQYFPSAEYLSEVLAGAVRAVAPGGTIFIGDVRSLPLLEAFHASVNFYQSSSALTSAQLLQRIQTRLMHEEELAIDPAFFTALQQQLPQISLVEARLKRGRNDNELTRFRYDAVLHIGPPDTPPTPAQTLDWQQAALSVDAVRQLLAEQTPDTLLIRRVPNARVQADVALAARLRAAEGTETVGDLRRGVSSGGIEPEDLWALSAELPYAVGIGWSGAGADNCFDVTFRRSSAESPGETIAAVAIDSVQQEIAPSYTNNPLQGRLVRRLIPQLRRFLEPRLPEYMLPSAFVALPALPRTPNGKLNRRMLPEPEGVRPALDVGYIEPRTEIERAVAAVWADVLQVERVGMDDNFFDLGGHSLLLVQLHSKLVQALGREISVIDLFKYPTISALAEYLRLDTATSVEAAEPVARQSENRRDEMRRQKDLRQRHRATKQQAGDEDDD